LATLSELLVEDPKQTLLYTTQSTSRLQPSNGKAID